MSVDDNRKDEIFHLQIIFSNILDTDQDWRYAGPDLDTLLVFLKLI